MDDSLRQIDATLTARGFKFARPPAIYVGPISVHGTEATVEIDVVDVTFARLPTVKLLDRSKLPINELAHIVSGRVVCYHDGGLVLDMYNPGGSVLRVLADAVTALERSFAGGAAAEFERELALYWQGKVVYFAVPCTAAASLITADVVPQSDDPSAGVVVVPKGAWAGWPKEVRVPATVISLSANLRHTARFPLPDLSAALEYLKTQPGLPAGSQAAVISAAARGEHLFLSAPNAIIG